MSILHIHLERQSSRSRPRQFGFTLTELLIVIAIVGLLAAAGLPSLSAFLANQRAKNAASTLLVGLVDARSTAIRLGGDVTFAPYVGGTTCQGGTTWNSGWCFYNSADATQTAIAQQAFKSVTLTGPTSVIYQASGRITVSTAPSFLVTAVSPGTAQWCLSVDPSGRPYIKQASSC